MYPMISNRQYKLDRIRHDRRCSLGMAILFLLVASVANAQQPALPYEAPDEELWGAMKTNMQKLSMPLEAHTQVQQILQSIEREASMRAQSKRNREKAAADAKAKAEAEAKDKK